MRFVWISRVLLAALCCCCTDLIVRPITDGMLLPHFHSNTVMWPSFVYFGRRLPVTTSFIHSTKLFQLYGKQNEPNNDHSHSSNPNILLSAASAGATGLYIHIPFCRRRCRYCNFAIVPIGQHAARFEDGTLDERQGVISASAGFDRMVRNYTDALLQELDLVKASHQQARDVSKSKIALMSIYFGGGTPSLAPISMLQQLLAAIRDDASSPFMVQQDAEITIEMDPGTFTLEKLQAIRSLGFNRISLGVQSFDDVVLESIGRVHRCSDIQQALSMLEKVDGHDEVNYSLDLISGLPGVSLADWSQTLATTVRLQPRPVHLSLYDLQIESGTVFGNWYTTRSVHESSTFKQTQGPVPAVLKIMSVPALPSEEDAAFMYKYAAGYLRAYGYEHYEISSYALLDKRTPSNLDHEQSFVSPKSVSKPSSTKRSRHNQLYWDYQSQWYAFGLGAASYLNGQIQMRPRALADYLQWVEAQNKVAAMARHDIENASNSDNYNKSNMITFDAVEACKDLVLKRLRTSDGLSLDWVRMNNLQFGDRYVDAILRGAGLGLELGLVTLDGGTVLRLVDPDGFLYSNSILSSIFVELDNIKQLQYRSASDTLGTSC